MAEQTTGGTWAVPGAAASPPLVALVAAVAVCLPLSPASVAAVALAAVACVAAGCGLSSCSAAAGCDY